MAIERRKQERDREDDGDCSLRLVEGRERELLATLRSPAGAEVAVARVLAIADARHDDGGEPEVLDAAHDRDRNTVRRISRPEDAVEDCEAGDCTGPASVHRGCVAGAALPEIEDAKEQRRRGPADQEEWEPVRNHEIGRAHV